MCSQSATNNAMRYMKVGHKQGFPSKQFCQSSLNVWSAQRLSSKQGSQSPQGVFTNTMASRYKKIKTAQDTFSKHFNQSSFQTRSPQYTFNNPTMCTVCISTEQPYKHIVTLQRQCKPVWNHEFIDHVIHYGSVAYGVGNFSKEEIVEESNAVDRGEPSLRYSNHNPKCWEIFVDGELAGDICVTQPPEKEITISVFDRFANKGVGENALKQFLAQTDLSPLTAIVKSGNPLLKPIVHMLERNNFQVVSRGAGLNVMLQWDRNRSRTDSF